MSQVKISQKLLDAIAQGEVDTILEGLNDPEMKKNPAFLAKVRQFLKDNDVMTTTETEGVKEIVRDAKQIPDLVSEDYVQ
jgi:t-SNARE complex subunit (syntaxin)